MSNLIIAIDGPAASGKSSVARRVAALMGCIYVDSGSLYRGLAWRTAREMSGEPDPEKVASIIEKARIDFFLESGAVRFTIDGADPWPELRSQSVQERVGGIAAMPRVRDWALGLLRGMTRFGDLVMEGRDIGTVVFPGTPYKFYLDAAPSERALRRYRETAGRDESADLSGVELSITERDALDSGRDIAPLRKASGAHVIDTTEMTIEQVASRIVDIVRR